MIWMFHILLLRGWARETRHWNSFPDVLGAWQGQANSVTSLDLPGAGTECGRLCPLSIPEIVEDLRYRWNSSAKQAGPRIILGVSLGGMIALQWAKQFPEDFDGAVVINTSLADYSKPWERLRWANLGSLLSAINGDDRVAREKRVLHM